MVERWNGKERKGGKEKMNLFMTLTKIGTYSWVLNFYGELMGERVRKHPSIPKNRTKRYWETECGEESSILVSQPPQFDH